jgi:predicted small lipoprotein YifL
MKRLLTLIAVVAFTLASFSGCGSKEVEIEVDPINDEAAAAQRQLMEQQMNQMMQMMPQPPQAPEGEGQPVDEQQAQ